MLPERFQRDNFQHALISAFQDNMGRLSGQVSLLPAQRAQAPLVSRRQAGKAPFRARRSQIVSPGPAEHQKLVAHDCAYYVDAGVVFIGTAAAVPEIACERVEGTRDKRLIKNISAKILFR